MAEARGTEDVGPFRNLRKVARTRVSTYYRGEHETHGKVLVESLDKAALASPGPARSEVLKAAPPDALDHGGILRVIDTVLHEGRLFVVRPAVEGETLAARVEREGPLPLKDVIAIGQQLIDALEYAHGDGVLHRDLCPEDVWLGPMDKVHLAGFGREAAVLAGRGSESRPGLEETLARLHAFRAPEQILHARDADRGADVHGLGGLLHFMATGEPPFAGEELEDLAEDVAGGPPFVPSSIRSELSQGFDQVVLKALAKKPEARFATAAFMAKALEMVRRGEATGIKVPGPVRYREWPWSLRMVIFALICEIAYLIVYDPDTLRRFGAQFKLLFLGP